MLHYRGMGMNFNQNAFLNQPPNVIEDDLNDYNQQPNNQQPNNQQPNNPLQGGNKVNLNVYNLPNNPPNQLLLYNNNNNYWPEPNNNRQRNMGKTIRKKVILNKEK